MSQQTQLTTLKTHNMTTEKLIQLWHQEVANVGPYVNSQRKATIEEMMKMRGIAIPKHNK